MDEPLVSVGMPVYNGEKYLRQALDSLLKQDYPNFELIISNNASTDQTEEICREYLKKDSRIIFYSKDKTIGAFENFVFVLKKSHGTYFMWAAHDDLWEPQFISSLVKILQNNADGNVAMSAIRRIWEDGEPHDILHFPYLMDTNNYDFLKVGKKIIAGEKLNIFIYGIFRKSFLESVIKNIPQVIAGDRLFILQLSLNSRLLYVDEILFVKRLIKTSIRDRYKNEEIGQQFHAKLLNTRYFFHVCTCLITSDIIPLTRKKYIPHLIYIQLFSNGPFMGTLSFIISDFTSLGYEFVRKLRERLWRT